MVCSLFTDSLVSLPPASFRARGSVMSFRGSVMAGVAFGPL